MNLNQLADKTLTHAVTRENGASEEVGYVHYLTKTKETLRCFPQNINDGELGKDTEKSYVAFHALYLEEKPNRGDSMEWNSQTYHFEKTLSQIGDSSFDVLAYITKHSPRSR